jgi:pimeloyl-ACP methyl ester carboxylesterase
MGADHRMYPAPWDKLPNFVAHDWLPHSHDRSLPEAARSIAEAFQIEDGDILVGASLGGMVSCEIAKIRQLRTLILVGSAVHPDEVSPLLKWLHPLAEVVPFEAVRIAAGKIPLELTQMFAHADPNFVRLMCNAIFEWEGLGETAVRCIRIHGWHDHVILPPPHAHLYLNAGHLVSMTHPVECTTFVRDLLEGRFEPQI